MLPLPTAVKIYVATEPVDLRKSFDGLSLVAWHVLEQDPLSGHLFCFFNRRGNQVRILFWDRTGWCIIAKRLSRGTFRIAHLVHDGAKHVELEHAELSLILEGIDLQSAKRRKRFRRMPSTVAQPSSNGRHQEADRTL